MAIQPDVFSPGGLPSGTRGFRTDSDVLVDQILAWDTALFRRDLGELPDAIQGEIRAAVREFLDLWRRTSASGRSDDFPHPVLRE